MMLATALLACAASMPLAIAEQVPTSPIPPPEEEPAAPPAETATLSAPEATSPGASPPAPAYSVGMMIQLRYQQTSVSIAPGLSALVRRTYPSSSIAADSLRVIEDTARQRDGLRLRRAFLRFDFDPTDYLRGEALLDFARLLYPDDPYEQGPTGWVRVASAKLTPIDSLAIEAGITEVPFSVLEQFHDTGLEVAEEGPTHELLHRLRIVGSDIGVIFHVAPWKEKKWLDIDAGVFDAGSSGAQASRVPGLFVLRVATGPVKPLALGAGLAWRPHAVDAWWEELRFRYQDFDAGAAFSTDVTLSFEKFVFRAEWLTGDRTDNDVAIPLKQRRGDARKFMSTWGMAALRWPAFGVTLMPAVRVEYLDTDREHSDVGGTLHLSAALNVDLSERVRLLGDVSRHYVQFGTRNWNFDLVRYDTDYVSGALQLQLKL